MIQLILGYLLLLVIASAISFGLIYLLRRMHWTRVGRRAFQKPSVPPEPGEREQDKLVEPRPERVREYGLYQAYEGRRSLSNGLIAILIGAGAQFAFVHDAPAVGLLGYLLAGLLFIKGMRAFLASSGLVARDPAPELASAPLAKAVKAKKPLQPSRPEGDLALRERVAFFREHWQDATLADVLAGFRIPTAVLKDQETVAKAADTPVIRLKEQDVSKARDQVITEPAKSLAVKVWRCGAGFAPQGLVATPQGELLVVDAGNALIRRYDAQGKLLGQWTVPDLPALTGTNMAVSPDSNTLYFSDENSGQIIVVSLPSGEEGIDD